jgi:hypothetical protein
VEIDETGKKLAEHFGSRPVTGSKCIYKVGILYNVEGIVWGTRLRQLRQASWTHSAWQ